MNGNRGNMVLAFLAGGAIGAGLALLFAPASGAETRKRLKEGAHDVTDLARNRAGEGVGKVTHLVEDNKEDLKAAYETGKDAFLKSREKHLLKESV